MELLPWLFTILVSSSLLLLLIRASHRTSRRRLPPTAAGAWPILGHLPALAGPKLLHIELGSMADKHGPIFTIQLGTERAVVVSDPELAKECFTINDRALATRPKAMALEIMGYNNSVFGLGPYGSYWRHTRKLTTLDFLSNRRVEMSRRIHFSEVRASINEIYGSCQRNGGSVVVEMKRWFGDLTMNIVVRMLAGKRYSDGGDESRKFQKALREFFEYEGMFVPSDYFSFLRWVDWGGYERSMKRVGKELDDILERWLVEHRRRRKSNGGAAREEDFIDLMLSKLDGGVDGGFEGRDADTIIKSTCLALLLGATETTTVSLTWALSLLLNHAHALQKTRDELSKQIGHKGAMEEGDRVRELGYLQSVIKETLRLYPAVPLLAPHQAIQDCTVGGYDIPAGTRLTVNCWKIQRDPRVWREPEEFRAERFMGDEKEVDFRGQDFELIPFGSGRRMCPGVGMAVQLMQITLGSLIHGFDLKTPRDEPVDMTEAHGLTNLKATPLNVVVSPRFTVDLCA